MAGRKKADAGAIEIATGGAEMIHQIGGMWKKLNDIHASSSPHFSQKYRKRTFMQRMEPLLKKASEGAVWIAVASRGGSGVGVGYCVCTVDSAKVGEVESIFVDESEKGGGLGSRLMEMGLKWISDSGAVETVLSVAAGNEKVLGFYEKWGFQPVRIVLQRIPDEKTKDVSGKQDDTPVASESDPEKIGGSEGNFFERVWAVAAKVPKGKVATYGLIGRLVGTLDARKVGFAMRSAPDSMNIPCHRVIRSDGALSPESVFGPGKQMKLLLDEGVTFGPDGRVDMKKCLWDGKQCDDDSERRGTWRIEQR